jgi:hypothetical protein
MACTNEINHLISHVIAATFNEEELDDVEKYVVASAKGHHYLPHNGATLKVLRSLFRKSQP